jgi:hypothetical protein
MFVTEPMFSPKELKDSMDKFIFEEMCFQRYCVATAPPLAVADHRLCAHRTHIEIGVRHRAYDPDSVLSRTGCGMVVDSVNKAC